MGIEWVKTPEGEALMVYVGYDQGERLGVVIQTSIPEVPMVYWDAWVCVGIVGSSTKTLRRLSRCSQKPMAKELVRCEVAKQLRGLVMAAQDAGLLIKRKEGES